ncbi:hypothetical protein D3C71_1614340 [compost metagenome]
MVQQVQRRLRPRLAFIGGDEQVEMAVVVIVAPGRADRVSVIVDTGFGGDFAEGAIAVVSIQQVCSINGDKDVEITVVVIVAYGTPHAAYAAVTAWLIHA